MSIRERVEEALTRELLTRRNMRVHFRFGDPIVSEFVKGTWVPTDPRHYHDAVKMAESLYDVVLSTVDFSRLALETMSAYSSLPDFNGSDDFGFHAGPSGAAIRAALETNDTFPDWATYWRTRRPKYRW